VAASPEIRADKGQIMRKADGTSGETASLRRRAEELLRAKTPEALPSPTAEELQRLVHELQIHQIELEMQNEELKHAREELEEALEKCTDLYDFAPVGYFTLDRDTLVYAANLAGATLLGLERSRLIGRRFELFLTEEHRPAFNAFLAKAFASETQEACEVTLVNKGTLRLFVQIEALASASGEKCRVAVIDITERRSAKDELARKRQELEDHNGALESRIVQAVDELRSKDQMLIMQERRAIMGDMINNIAHQWRLPLNLLGLNLQELQLVVRPGECGAKEVEDNVDKCMQLIMHMSQTIDDFMNFFKPAKGGRRRPLHIEYHHKKEHGSR
jgi:PAS domain S-box-containing protein